VKTLKRQIWPILIGIATGIAFLFGVVALGVFMFFIDLSMMWANHGTKYLEYIYEAMFHYGLLPAFIVGMYIGYRSSIRQQERKTAAKQ